MGFVTNAPPSVTASASAATIIAGFGATFTATAAGTPPLSYQWYFNTNTLIASATNSAYTLPAIQTGDAGVYTVIVTNLYGLATNSASVSVLPNGSSLLTTQIWSLAPGSRPYLTTDNNQRGLAFDPVLNRVVLVSRSSTNGVHLLDADTGADAGELDYSALLAFTPPGTFPINMTGVGDDGAVYVANLITSGTADTFAIYRWDSATPTASVVPAYYDNPGLGRIGDTLAVRGAGVNTEILASFRTGTNVALFTTGDGVNFSFNLITITNLPDDAQANGFAGLGLAFGPGNTFWAKSTGFNLRQVAYDLASNSGSVIATYVLPGTEAPIGVDNTNGYVAAIGVSESPQNPSVATWEMSLFAPGTGSSTTLVVSVNANTAWAACAA
ncbi:MAG: immunoglobulin domain-containing protein [Limisphaerales bacterium]